MLYKSKGAHIFLVAFIFITVEFSISGGVIPLELLDIK